MNTTINSSQMSTLMQETMDHVKNEIQKDTKNYQLSLQEKIKEMIQQAVEKSAGTNHAYVYNGTAAAVTQSAVTVTNSLTDAEIQNLPLSDLLLRVTQGRANEMDKLVREFAAKVNDANRRLKALSDIKAALSTLSTDGNKPNDKSADKDVYLKARKEVDAICQREGISIPWGDYNFTKEGILTKGSVQKLMTSLDGQTQSINNFQSSDMTQLQNYTQKYNQALELGSNFMKKIFDTQSGLIANMR